MANDDLDMFFGERFPVPPELEAEYTTLRAELKELRERIRVLGDLLASGVNSVRAELNPAIRREREASSQLWDLRRRAGIPDPPPVMYGPPWG
jgi:hypothetical protein